MKSWFSVVVFLFVSVTAVQAAVPVIDSLAVNTTYGFGTSSENLTISASYSDADNDTVTNITSWLVNGAPFEVLNLAFPGGSNSTFTRDYSDYAHAVTVFGPVYNPNAGPMGQGAYVFNGSTDMVVADNPVLRLASGEDMSISLWVNTSGSAAVQALVAKRIHLPGVGEYTFHLTTSNVLVGRLVDNEDDSSVAASNISLQNNTWYHVAWVVDGLNTQYVYINGELTGSNSVATIGDIETTRLVEIGSGNHYFASSIQKLFGQMTDVYMFKRALSHEQVRLLYQEGIHRIANAQTSTGQNWTACVTPNDGTQDGAEVCSSLVLQNVNQFLGNESDVNASGVSALNITLDGSDTLSVTDFETHIVSVYDGQELLINMTHDFSQSKINLSATTIARQATGLLVDFNGASGSVKTLYLNDSSSQVFCVKNAPITSFSQIGQTCQGSGEIQFSVSECLASATKSGVTCQVSNGVYAFSGLSYSGVLGAQSFAVPEFHEWALMILLTVALAGVLSMRRK